MWKSYNAHFDITFYDLVYYHNYLYDFGHAAYLWENIIDIVDDFCTHLLRYTQYAMQISFIINWLELDNLKGDLYNKGWYRSDTAFGNEFADFQSNFSFQEITLTFCVLFDLSTFILCSSWYTHILLQYIIFLSFMQN